MLDQVIHLADENKQDFIDVEQQILGFHHGEVGARIAEKWRLPEELVEAIATHHNPSDAVINPKMTAIVHIADGIVMMIPNLLPIFIVLAIMEMTNTPLDFLNVLIVTLSMGLVVDDTIHFSGHFKDHFNHTHDAVASVKKAIQDTGRAMFVTTLVLTLGWHMLLLSQFEQLGLFGMLTSAIMVLGLIADLLVAPALFIWLYSGAKQKSAD